MGREANASVRVDRRRQGWLNWLRRGLWPVIGMTFLPEYWSFTDRKAVEETDTIRKP
jgi:hypothetical protein